MNSSDRINGSGAPPSAEDMENGAVPSVPGRAPPELMFGAGIHSRKRPRQGVLVTPLSRQMYDMMIRQLHHDGYLAAASAVADATGAVVHDVEQGGNRLSQVVADGLHVETLQQRSVEEFTASQVVERYISASKVYVPLSLTSRWSVGRRYTRMRERFISASLGAVVRDISFSPDGTLISCAGTNGLAAVFSLETIEDLCSLDEVRAANQTRGVDGSKGAPREQANPTSTSPPPESVATRGAATRNANEVTELAMIRRFPEHTQSVEVMRFHPTEAILLTGGREGDLYLRNYAFPDSKVLLKSHDSFAVRSASFHPGGDYVLIGTDHQVPRLLNIHTEKIFTTPGSFRPRAGIDVGDKHEKAVSHTAGLTSVEFSPDGRTFATAGLDGTWMLHDGASGKVIFRSENAHSAVSVTSVSYSRTGNVLLTAGMDSTARLWDLRKVGGPTFAPNATAEIMSFGEPAKCNHRSIQATFSCDESHVFCHDATLLAVHSYCVYTGSMATTLTTQPAFTLRGLAASPWANLLVTGGDDSRLRLWSSSWLPG